MKESHEQQDAEGGSYLDELHAKREAIRKTIAAEKAGGFHRRGPVMTPGLNAPQWEPFDSPDSECPTGGMQAFIKTATSKEVAAFTRDFLRKCGVAIGAVLAISLPSGCNKDGNLVASLSDVADGTVLADGEADDLPKSSAIQDYVKP